MEKMKSLFEFIDFLKSMENPLIEKRPLIEELTALYQRRDEIDRRTCTPIEAAEYKKIENEIDTIFAKIALYDDILEKSEHFHVSVPMVNSELERFYETATEEQKNSLSNEILNNIDKYRDFITHAKGLLYISLPCNLEKVLEYLYKLYDTTGLGWLEERPRMVIPNYVLKWLQKEICHNGKPFIDDAAARHPNWLQNKQLARELLTHEKIRGNLPIATAVKQAPYLFFYPKESKPLNLEKSKSKKTAYTWDNDRLNKFLATL